MNRMHVDLQYGSAWTSFERKQLKLAGFAVALQPTRGKVTGGQERPSSFSRFTPITKSLMHFPDFTRCSTLA